MAQLSLPDGTRRTKTHKTKRECQLWLRNQQRWLDVGLVSYIDLTFADLADRWLANKQGSVVDSTWEDYSRYLRLHLNPLLGSRLVSNITPLLIDSVLLQKKKEFFQRESRHSGNRTLQAIYQVLSMILDYGYQLEIIHKNPIHRVNQPRYSGKDEMNVLTPTQADRLISVAKHYSTHAFYALALETGLRQGELLGMC